MAIAGSVLAVIGALLIVTDTVVWTGIPLLSVGAAFAVGNFTFILLSRKTMGKQIGRRLYSQL
jgi:hypothetical protein